MSAPQDLIAEAITGHYGERCEDFADGCACCEAWAQHDLSQAAVAAAYEAAAGVLQSEVDAGEKLDQVYLEGTVTLEMVHGWLRRYAHTIRALITDPERDALAAAIATARAEDAAKIEHVRHVKRGSTYSVLGRGKVQTDTPLTDYAEVVIYQSDDDGMIWVRPVGEFKDGRFAQIGDAP